MKILSIDTSCDETAAAVTDKCNILSNVIWSQASAHANFGGVMPSLAERMHKERIDWVVNESLRKSKIKTNDLDAIAVTVGPGLSIALGVGITKAKELASQNKLPLLPINHIEAHLLSPLALPANKKATINMSLPAYGLVVSGGNTIFAQIYSIGSYKILAETQDDALGEALDKAARMIGLGYPGGALLEKMAQKQTRSTFKFPIPLVGQEKRQIFSYSGLKTSISRYIQSQKQLNKDFPTQEDIFNLAGEFQKAAFEHLTRTMSYILSSSEVKPKTLFFGGGVSNNLYLRQKIRMLGKKFGFRTYLPYTKRLCGDNAAMIGVCAYLKYKEVNLSNYLDYSNVDRRPRLPITENLNY